MDTKIVGKVKRDRIWADQFQTIEWTVSFDAEFSRRLNRRCHVSEVLPTQPNFISNTVWMGCGSCGVVSRRTSLGKPVWKYGIPEWRSQSQLELLHTFDRDKFAGIQKVQRSLWKPAEVYLKRRSVQVVHTRRVVSKLGWSEELIAIRLMVATVTT